MKELEHKIRVKKWCSNRIFLVTVANADIRSVKFGKPEKSDEKTIVPLQV